MRILPAILITLMSLPALAGDYDSEIDKFFELYEAGKQNEAVDSIYGTNPWMTSAADAIHNVKTQLNGIEQIVGSYNGKERIGERDISGRFIHITYLALYDRQPVRMEFQFYRPKEDWIIYSFSFDVDFDDELEAAERLRIASGD